MVLFDLGMLPGQQSMLVFHALARMGMEALVIVSPQSPLVSIGYFQNAEKEVDIDYCKSSGISVMRRETGGSMTYLDEHQVFYQLIWSRDNPRFPKLIGDIYLCCSEAAVETYRAFGIEVEFQPINDIVTKEGKKIAGEGGADIGECMVFVGGILLDFNYERMCRALKVPDETFREKVYRAMKEHLTTMKQELKTPPRREEVVSVLKEKFGKRFGPFEQASLTQEIRYKMDQLEVWMTSDEFLFKKTPRIPKGVKIKEGVEVLYDSPP